MDYSGEILNADYSALFSDDPEIKKNGGASSMGAFTYIINDRFFKKQ